MGVTNPGYQPDDKSATAFPASIVVGASFNPTLARFDGKARQWWIADGAHRLALGRSAGDLVLTAEAPLTARLFGK